MPDKVFTISYTCQQSANYIHGILSIHKDRATALATFQQVINMSIVQDFKLTYCATSKEHAVLTRITDGQTINLYVEEKELL